MHAAAHAARVVYYSYAHAAHIQTTAGYYYLPFFHVPTLEPQPPICLSPLILAAAATILFSPFLPPALGHGLAWFVSWWTAATPPRDINISRASNQRMVRSLLLARVVVWFRCVRNLLMVLLPLHHAAYRKTLAPGFCVVAGFARAQRSALFGRCTLARCARTRASSRHAKQDLFSVSVNDNQRISFSSTWRCTPQRVTCYAFTLRYAGGLARTIITSI